jgi:hypothetical protein
LCGDDYTGFISSWSCSGTNYTGLVIMEKSRRPRSVAQQTATMERARDLLQRVVTDIRRNGTVTPEGVATVSSCITTVALLEHEIGRRLSTPMNEITNHVQHLRDVDEKD